MSMIRTVVVSAMGMALGVASAAQAAEPGKAGGGMSFPMALVVTDTTGLSSAESPLYFASNLNGWNPADPKWKLTRVGESSPPVWEIALTPQQLASGSVEFKITRGSWETVEVQASGADAANRTIGESSWAMEGARLVMKAEIAGFADQRGTRWPNQPLPEQANVDRTPSVIGDLEVFQINSPIMLNTRAVRVWLPPGYKDEKNKDRRYPVLYLNDGQNVFDRATSFLGVEWGADESVIELMEDGVIGPMIVVGIDNVGSVRAHEYNPPYTQWDGKANYADKYLEFVTTQVMDYVNSTYRTLKGPEHTAFGGSSFGGNVALYAMMTRPEVFGTFLVESPACFISDKAIVTALKEHTGPWPRRVFVAVGTAESSRAGDAEAYLNTVKELAEVLRSKGLGEDRMKFVVEEGGVHNEGAWAARLPGALGFLFGE